MFLILLVITLNLSCFPAVPVEELLHVSDFVDDLLLAMELPRVELSVLEVKKHDCKQTHPDILII